MHYLILINFNKLFNISITYGMCQFPPVQITFSLDINHKMTFIIISGIIPSRIFLMAGD